MASCPTLIECVALTLNVQSFKNMFFLAVASAPADIDRIQKQIDTAVGDNRTSSSMINAVVGGVATSGNLVNQYLTALSLVSDLHCNG